MGLALAALLATLVAPSATPVLTAGWQGARVRASVDDARVETTVQQVPRLGLLHFGGDWYLRLEAGGLLSTGLEALGLETRTLGGAASIDGRTVVAHLAPSVLGGGEIGVHWYGTPVLLALGLELESLRFGVADADRSGPWLAGGLGLEVGLAFRASGRLGPLIIDPVLSAGGGALWNSGFGYRGVHAQGELALRLDLGGPVWPRLGVQGSLRSYAPEAGLEGPALEATSFSVELGVAVPIGTPAGSQ